MEQLLNDVLKKIGSVQPLVKSGLSDDIASVRYPLGWLLVNNYTWSSERIRKMYSNRVTLRMPFLDVMGNGMYPADEYDVPIFIFDISRTRKKIVTYINLVKSCEDKEYAQRYIDPFADLYEKYRHFGSEPMPEWMSRHQSRNCLYAMPTADRYSEVRDCVMGYLDRYLQLLCYAGKITDAAYQAEVSAARQRFISDLITKDRAQKALGRLIGKRRLRLFQHEVLS